MLLTNDNDGSSARLRFAMMLTATWLQASLQPEHITNVTQHVGFVIGHIKS